MRAAGTLSPVIFYCNHGQVAGSKSEQDIGYISLAPYSDHPTPPGHSRHEAGTLTQVDELQKRLQEQEHRRLEKELQFDHEHMEEGRKRIAENLRAKMVSSSTSAYEREFIELWLKLRDEKRRERHKQRLTEYQMFITAREMDLHGRGGGEEVYKGTLNEHGK